MRHAKTCQTIPLTSNNDIYVFSVTPLQDDTFLALRSDDTITAFTTSSTSPSILWSLNTGHTGTNQTLIKQVGNQTVVLTAGNDGSIRVWDPRQSTNAVQTMKHSPAPILSLASHPTSTILAAGAELHSHEAVLQFWDLRSPGTVVHKYTESHSDDITELHYHPTNASCLLSGSVDGLVNVYDTNVLDEDDAVFQVFNHGSSIHHANFLEDDVVYALSNDEQLSLYKLTEPGSTEEEEPSVCAFGDVRPYLECDYVVDVVNSPNGPFVCAGTFDKNRLDLIPLRKTPAWDFRLEDSIRLNKGLGEEIVRSVYLDHVNDRVIAGVEDSEIRVWSQFE